MEDVSLCCSNNEKSFVTVENSVIVEISQAFINMTGYMADELLQKDIEEVFRLLRVSPSININDVEKSSSCFIFTKSFQVTFVDISLTHDNNKTKYMFYEKKDNIFESKMEFVNGLAEDNYYGVAVYSVPDSILIKANEKYMSFFDEPYSFKENCIGRCIDEVMPGFRGSDYEGLWNRVIRTKKTCKLDEYVKERACKDITYWRLTAVPIFEDEIIKYCVIMATEMPKQVLQTKKVGEQSKNLEHQMFEQQKAQLEAIVESIDDAMLILDANKKCYLMNEAAKQYFPNHELNKADAIPNTYKYYDFEGKEILKEDMVVSKIFRGEVVTNDGMVLKNGKETRYLSVSGRAIYDNSGNIKSVVLCSHDITQEVKAQKVIENQKKLLETIVENLQEALYVCDKDGKFILRTNNRAPVEAKSDNSIEDMYNGGKYYRLDRTEIPIEEMAGPRAIRGLITKNNIIYVKTHGLAQYLLINGVPIFDENHQLMYAIVSAFNITDLMKSNHLLDETYRRLLKSEHEKNEALQKSIDMKDDFLSLISHEFRTPLNVITTAIQALNVICAGEMTDRVKKYITIIRQNTFRQLRLVNNLLDITRANAGRIKINKKNTDIVFLTRVITESVYAYASQKGIQVTFLTSFEKQVIGIDDEKYERILLNLLSNAIKFTPEGKSIIVNLRHCKGKICLQVTDKGIGIPQDKMNVIFERFGQVDSSLSRQAEGSGIGLSLVKRFVEALEGSISVRSKEGKGTTFTVLLPNEKVVEQQQEEQMVDLMDNRLIESTKIEFSDIYL